MHRLTKLGLCAALLWGSTAVVLRADDMSSAAKEPTKQEKKEAREEAKAEVKELRLVEPWKHLTTLSPEQRSQIHTIHAKALDEISEIRAREKVEILALLSDEQKAELKAYQQKRTMERKLKDSKDASAEPAAQADDEAGSDKAGM